jgi:hypothetical protein
MPERFKALSLRNRLEDTQAPGGTKCGKIFNIQRSILNIQISNYIPGIEH